MAKKPLEPVKINVTFTEGWQERMAKAAVDLYYRVEERKKREAAEAEKCKEVAV
jgi:hypothetical protein